MSENDLCFLSASQLGERLSRREVSPVEVVRAHLERIERLDRQLNCYLEVFAEQALGAAEAAQREIAAGDYRGPLHGIPVALKDLFDLAGTRTTGSSKILADNVARADSTVTRRLKDAGAIMLGKTNLHEFAFGVTTNNPHTGPTRNPWDLSRVPGGSSGGSGAGLAAGLCTLATGSDTGGSIRIPAFLCGIVGIKPTFGRVSKGGVLPLAWSMDHAGPMARTVEDAALMLGAMAGYDPADPTTVDVAVPDYRAAVGRPVKGRRLGIPREFFFADVDDQVKAAVEAAIAHYEGLGLAVQEVSLPRIAYAGSAFALTIHSEAAAYHEPWLRSRPQDYGADVRTRLEVGRTVLATEYINAQRARGIVRADFEAALGQVDALIAPAMPALAQPIGQDQLTIGNKTFETRAAYNRLTSPINLIGLPAIAVPCGFSREGLPIGFQLVGRAFDEAGLISLAHAYEQSTDWHTRRPPLA